jgi:hypothetical protein
VGRLPNPVLADGHVGRTGDGELSMPSGSDRSLDDRTPADEEDDMPGQNPASVVDQLVDANQFYIDAPILVHYDSTSLNGQPLLTYRDTEHDLHFSGEEVTRATTSIGELVTVTLDDVPDAFTRTFTLVVPLVRTRTQDEVEFAALGIETTHRSGAFVPPPGPAGVLQTYRVHQLSGVARFVISIS